MARILGEDGQIYHPLSLSTFVEPETQRQLRSKSHLIFPGFTFVLCDPLIVSDYDARKPDFVLIENEYRSWWVGEVEKSVHSLEGHVLPQVDTFKNGYYNETHVKRISKQCKTLDTGKLQSLIDSEPPNVLVVADRLVPDWISRLESKGAYLALFEIFRSATHRYLFRVNGFCPTPPSVYETDCRVPASMPQILQLASPARLNLAPRQIISILCHGVWSDWSVIVTEGDVWLRPVEAHTLEVERKYRFLQQQDGTFEIREMKR